MSGTHDQPTTLIATDPHTGRQFMVVTYADSHGITRTVAARDHAGATWGPEHVLLPADEMVGRTP